MDAELNQRFALLNTYTTRLQEELEPARVELVGWFQTFFRRRRPPQNSTRIRAVLQTQDGIEFQLICNWAPRATRSMIFTPTVTGPTISDTELATLGLQPEYRRFIAHIAFYNLTVSAWVEAGGFAYTHPLNLDNTNIEDANPPCVWLDHAHLYIRNTLDNTPHQRGAVRVRQPVTRGTNPPSPAILAALQRGAISAPTDWAHELAEASDTATAAVLRNFAGLRDSLAAEVLPVAPEFGFSLYSEAGIHGWWIGDMDSETDNQQTRIVAEMLSRWNDLYPALEWMFRSYNLATVNVESVTVATGIRADRRDYNLAAGEHFTPFDPPVAITRVVYLPADAGE